MPQTQKHACITSRRTSAANASMDFLSALSFVCADKRPIIPAQPKMNQKAPSTVLANRHAQHGTHTHTHTLARARSHTHIHKEQKLCNWSQAYTHPANRAGESHCSNRGIPNSHSPHTPAATLASTYIHTNETNIIEQRSLRHLALRPRSLSRLRTTSNCFTTDGSAPKARSSFLTSA